MKVRVVKQELYDAEKSIINTKMKDFLSIGQRYVVYAITIQKTANYVQIYVNGKLISVPLDLFEIEDARVSKYWKISYIDFTVRFWPNEFYEEYFHDDLFEEVPKIVEKFIGIKNMLDNEFENI